MTATLNVSGLPYLKLGFRSMVGLEGWKLVGGCLLLFCCICMVAAKNFEDGILKAGGFFDVWQDRSRHLVEC